MNKFNEVDIKEAIRIVYQDWLDNEHGGVARPEDMERYYQQLLKWKGEHDIPIPLTPEWLERCGLKQKPLEPDDLPQWENLNMNIAQYTDGFYLYTVTSDPWHDQAVGKKIEYIHQLQNISLALFGEELKIDL